ALAAAFLFGVTTPIAKHLVSTVDPWLMAGLLYTGCGLGIGLLLLGGMFVSGRHGKLGLQALALRSAEVPWLVAATVAGGIVAPVLLMLGLRHVDAASASLLLNLELVF